MLYKLILWTKWSISIANLTGKLSPNFFILHLSNKMNHKINKSGVNEWISWNCGKFNYWKIEYKTFKYLVPEKKKNDKNLN